MQELENKLAHELAHKLAHELTNKLAHKLVEHDLSRQRKWHCPKLDNLL